jgi:hypothetical protein
MYNWGSFEKKKGWDGLNDAAINTFNGDVINSFVREMFQNSNDARQKEDGKYLKLKIQFEHKKVASDNIVAFQQLRGKVKLISECNKDHEVFFKNALQELDSSEVGIFVYKDFNTSGLSGDDDDENSTFNACVLSEGVSIKDNKNSIGSFGIGKNSIYGLSKIRTVIYSSLNREGESIFQGVSKLASHKEQDKTFERRLYFGKNDSLSSLRGNDLEELDAGQQELYKRSEPGLSQFALCPNLAEDWEDQFIRAILTNYWLLLLRGELEVSIKTDNSEVKILNSDSLDEYMMKYFDPVTYDPNKYPSGNPYDFYNCYMNVAPVERDIYMLGNVKFYFCELSHKKTNKILYVRNGMVIYSDQVWGFGSIGYCGIIICDSDEGNQYLKMMEPPEHNRFDPQRLKEKTEKYKVKDGKKALDELRLLITESLNSIMDKYRKKPEEISWLNELLKSIAGSKDKGNGDKTNEDSEEESFLKKVRDLKLDVSITSDDTNEAIIAIPGQKPGSSKGYGVARKREKNSGGLPNPGKFKRGAGRSQTASFRTFLVNRDNQKGLSLYRTVIHSDSVTTGKLLVKQIGDSGVSMSYTIQSVKADNGQELNFSQQQNKKGEVIGYGISDVPIPSTIDFVVIEPYKSSFSFEEL